MSARGVYSWGEVSAPQGVCLFPGVSAPWGMSAPWGGVCSGGSALGRSVPGGGIPACTEAEPLCGQNDRHV